MPDCSKGSTILTGHDEPKTYESTNIECDKNGQSGGELTDILSINPQE